MLGIDRLSCCPSSYCFPSASGSIDRICELAKKVASIGSAILRFPLRYIGSKYRCKGYHRFDIPTLQPEEAASYRKDAVMATAIQNEDFETYGVNVLSPKLHPNMPEGLEICDHVYFDRKSGLKVALFQDEEGVVICFGAARSYEKHIEGEEAKKKMGNKMEYTFGSSLLGSKPFIFRQADQFLKAVQQDPRVKGKKIRLVSHCSGGLIASYLALQHRIKATCFNTLPMGAGLQQEVGRARLNEADNFITHLIVKGDLFANKSKLLGYIDAIVNFLGVKTPGNFGKKFHLEPSPEHCGWFDRHNRFLRHIVSSMGHSFDLHRSEMSAPNLPCINSPYALFPLL